MHIYIITPEKTVFSGEAQGVTFPTIEGELTVLENHLPLITIIKSGEITLHLGKERRHMAIHGGFVEVLNNQVRFLADSVELEEEIDERRAAAALERAQKAIAEARDQVATADASAALERALARLKVAERKKYRHKV